MQLSRLEIKGFKSFAEYAVINFNDGVTGIVGPNGCGKSNVVDAIRWVLGEQRTKALRSDKMENVIFNGTEKRKAATMAQVALTFDNNKNLLPAEYSQVTITRRYYRTGESEYLINDVRCRLKDIHNLFLDTGIGADSYAIIELKKVDELLNDKEGSRRDLFEKAAGISKYKAKKKEALTKLEHTDTDLARVGDWLFEIEKNLKTLEKQAKQAEKFFSLKEEYKKYSLIYAKKSLEKQQTSLLNLSERLKNEIEKRVKCKELLENQEVQLEKEKNQINELEIILQKSKNQWIEHKGKIKQLENEQKIKAEKLHFLQEKIKNIRQQIDTDFQNQKRLKEDKNRLENQYNETEKTLEEKEKQVKTLQNQYDKQRNTTAEWQQKTKSLETQKQSLENQLFQQNKNAEFAQVQLNKAKIEAEKILQSDNEQQNKAKKYVEEIQILTVEIERTAQEVLDWQKKDERRGIEILEAEQNLDKLREILAQIKRNRDAKWNEYQLLQSLVEKMDDFSDALKYLQKETSWGQNIPLLSDIIACEEKYKIAIENYLEPYLNYYVVNDIKEAYQAIELLETSKKGKANFFILSHLNQVVKIDKNYAKNSALNAANMFLSGAMPILRDENKPIIALEVINFEPEHESLVQYLLMNVLVVKDIKMAENLSKEKAFVSVDGRFLRRNFALNGGSIGAFEGKRIGRAKQIENLQIEIQDLDNQIKSEQENLDFQTKNLLELKRNLSLKDGLRQAQSRLQTLKEQNIMLKNKQEQIDIITKASWDRQNDITEQMAECEEQLREINPKIKLLKNQIEEVKIELENAQFENETQQENLQSASAQFNQQNIVLFQQKNLLQKIEQELQFKNENENEIKNRLQKLQIDLENTEIELENSFILIDELALQVQNLQTQTPEIEKIYNEQEQSFYKMRGEVVQEEKNIKETQRQKDLQDGIIHQIEIKIHETEVSQAGWKERLAVEFQMTLEDIFATENTTIDLPDNGIMELDLKGLVDDLKQKIDKIGTINALAMEEYNVMMERHTFIATQKNDLESAKKILLDTINEMETFAKEAFMEAFTKIRNNFIQVFRSLFSAEDKADLVLASPENPLESVIEITAQPKGKRPLTIDQLSGGEKTLTAISLLFALYLLKPAPFCIFDEVDAPLDDANTEKFNKIIKEFSNDSQFIIVTHNKRTMASTDIMYGVTMLTQGVSSVVPVDLRAYAGV